MSGSRDLLVVATADGVEVDRIAAPKPLTRAQSRLRAAQRCAARRCGPYDPDTKTPREPSKRWERATARVGRIHASVAAIRAHEIHTVTPAWPPGTRSLRLSRCPPRTWAAVVVGANAASTGRSAMPRSGGSAPNWTTRPLVWHRIGDRATILSVDSTVLPLRGENQTPAARPHLSLPQRMPTTGSGSECGDQPARLGDPSHGATGTGTGSRPAASVTAGDGRGAIHKTSPTPTPGAVGTAGGDETSTPHTTHPGAGTAAPQGEAA